MLAFVAIDVGAGKFLGVRKIFAQIFPKVFDQLFVRIFPPFAQIFWNDPKKDIHVILHIGRHFCPYFQIVRPDF